MQIYSPAARDRSSMRSFSRLVKKGYSVRVQSGGKRISLWMAREYRQCDVNDYSSLREVIRGCKAVVHLAALPTPSKGTPEEIFRINAREHSTFSRLRRRRYSPRGSASSINAAGQYYGQARAAALPPWMRRTRCSPPMPIPSRRTSSKRSAILWRREGISSVAYRLPWVAPSGLHENIAQRREQIHNVVGKLQSHLPEEHRAWFEKAWRGYNEFRAQRPYEKEGYAFQLLNSLPDEQRDLVSSISYRVTFSPSGRARYGTAWKGGWRQTSPQPRPVHQRPP